MQSVPITSNVASSNPAQTSDKVYSIQHYVIKFVSDLRQVGGFSLYTPVSCTNKTDHQDITEILLKCYNPTLTKAHCFMLFCYISWRLDLKHIFNVFVMYGH